MLFCFFSSFKLFLELEPQLRDIIFRFYESKYASCLKLLDEIKVIRFNFLKICIEVKHWIKS